MLTVPTMKICGCRGSATALQSGAVIRRPAKELRLWGSLMRQRAGIQKAYQRVMDRELTKAKEECLVKLHRAGQKNFRLRIADCGLKAKAVAADFLFDLANFTRGMQAGVRAVGAEGLQTAGQQLYDEIGYPDPFRFPPKEVVEFLAARQNKLKNVPQGIYDRIRVVIQDKLETGRPIAEIASEIAANVEGEFDAISEGRAAVIARTETLTCYGAGRDEAMISAGITHKKWLSAGDDDVRPDHAEANGQIVEIDEPFEVGSYKLDFPGDDSYDAPAGEIVNCRCVSIPCIGKEKAACMGREFRRKTAQAIRRWGVLS